MNKPLLGGHVSAAGGLATAFDRAEEIGADVIQIFGCSPRQWNVSVPSLASAKTFHDCQRNSRVKKVFLHAAYLVNLASPEPHVRERSIGNLAAHLTIAKLLNAEGLILHLGSGKELPKDEALTHVADGISRVLELVPGTTPLIMENSAGGGQKIGATPQDMGRIIKHIDSPRIRICFDTAHAFEAGLIPEYTPQRIAELFDVWDQEVGISNIAALHINDSKTVFNSHHDRHENLGKGHIGLDGFKNLAEEQRLWRAGWILEVPGFTNEGPDAENIRILRSCFEN